MDFKKLTKKKECAVMATVIDVSEKGEYTRRFHFKLRIQMQAISDAARRIFDEYYGGVSGSVLGYFPGGGTVDVREKSNEFIITWSKNKKDKETCLRIAFDPRNGLIVDTTIWSDTAVKTLLEGQIEGAIDDEAFDTQNFPIGVVELLDMAEWKSTAPTIYP